MSQSRKGSAFESITNVVVGLCVSFVVNAVVYPLFGWHINGAVNIELCAIYTVVSLVRSYALRRMFNCFVGTHARGSLAVPKEAAEGRDA